MRGQNSFRGLTGSYESYWHKIFSTIYYLYLNNIYDALVQTNLVKKLLKYVFANSYLSSLCPRLRPRSGMKNSICKYFLMNPAKLHTVWLSSLAIKITHKATFSFIILVGIHCLSYRNSAQNYMKICIACLL